MESSSIVSGKSDDDFGFYRIDPDPEDSQEVQWPAESKAHITARIATQVLEGMYYLKPLFILAPRAHLLVHAGEMIWSLRNFKGTETTENESRIVDLSKRGVKSLNSVLGMAEGFIGALEVITPQIAESFGLPSAAVGSLLAVTSAAEKYFRKMTS